MIRVRLTEEGWAKCERAARARMNAAKINPSWASQPCKGGRVTSDYLVDLVGIVAENCFAAVRGLDSSEWQRVVKNGRPTGSTDFRVGGKTVELKATYTPLDRDPKLVLSVGAKRSDLYVLCCVNEERREALFVGWAKDRDFPDEPVNLRGFRAPVYAISASKLRDFRKSWQRSSVW